VIVIGSIYLALGAVTLACGAAKLITMAPIKIQIRAYLVVMAAIYVWCSYEILLQVVTL